MAKMFSKTKIIRMKNGDEEVIPARTVFDATPAEAIQFDKLKAARNATEAEVKAAAERKALDEGTTFQAPAPSDSVLTETVAMPDSGAVGDPKSSPKGKTA